MDIDILRDSQNFSQLIVDTATNEKKMKEIQEISKKQVEKIILITADSDFIPAIKMARKEGIIIQLDPMQNEYIKQELLEHLDILASVFPKDRNAIDPSDPDL